MKPASIIALIIAAVLIVAGVITCSVASNMAKKEGTPLFAEKVDDDYVRKVDLSGPDITKIELLVGKAIINIYGQCEKADPDSKEYRETSCAEFINFQENYYSLSVTNRVLSFDEVLNLTSMFKFWENGFSFKGIRHYLNLNAQPDLSRDKVINIYLTSGKSIKILNVRGESCTVNLINMTTGTDYMIEADDLVLNADSLRTSSTLRIGSEKSPCGRAVLNMTTRTYANSMSVYATDLDMDVEHFRCIGTAEVHCDTGRVQVQSVRKMADMTLFLRTTSGSIEVNGSLCPSPYASEAEGDASSLTVETKSASIQITTSENTETAEQTNP